MQWLLTQLAGGVARGGAFNLLRVFYVLAIIPMVFRSFVWCLKFFWKAYYFLLGWTFPARVAGDAIRFRRLTLFYWLIIPASAIFGNRYGWYSWIGQSLDRWLGEERIDGWQTQVSSLLGKVESIPGWDRISEGLSFFSEYALNPHTYVVFGIFYTLILIAQLKRLNDGWQLSFLALGSAVCGFLFFNGVFDFWTAKVVASYQTDPGLTIAWGLFGWWLVTTLYAVLFESYDYFPNERRLERANWGDPSQDILHNENTAIIPKLRNIVRFILWGGGYDLIGFAKDPKEPHDAVEIRFSFGFAFAMAAWRIIFKTKVKHRAILDGSQEVAPSTPKKKGGRLRAIGGWLRNRRKRSKATEETVVETPSPTPETEVAPPPAAAEAPSSASPPAPESSAATATPANAAST